MSGLRKQVRALRDVASQVCQIRKFSFKVFMEDRGLEDAEANDWPAKEIAGQVLARCCLADGKFNNFQVGLLTIMTYLNEQLGKLGQGETQAFTDLVAILKNAGSVKGRDDDPVREVVERNRIQEVAVSLCLRPAVPTPDTAGLPRAARQIH